MTHQGLGKELRASPGTEAAGGALRRCEALLEGTAAAEGGTFLCREERTRGSVQTL